MGNRGPTCRLLSQERNLDDEGAVGGRGASAAAIPSLGHELGRPPGLGKAQEL